MINLTPQQMRWIASDREETAETWPEYRIIAAKLREDAAALRTAADQLEAVQGWADHADPVYADLSGLYAILTADTAPQEGRDD